jgi:membrane-associated phospholipid phosphatase
MKTENSYIFFRFIIIALLYFILYLLNNRYQFFSPLFIPLTQIDEMIPFIPMGIYIYLLAYIQPTVSFLYLYKNKDYKNVYFLQNHIFIIALIANIIFFLLPTTIVMPFAKYTLTDFLKLTDVFTAHCLVFIYNTDRPFNCLPSLHVAASFVSSYVLWKASSKPIFIISLLFSVAVALSTLMVKQHIFYDVIFGFFLSLVTLPLVQKSIAKLNS